MNRIASIFKPHEPLSSELSVQFNVLRAIAALLVCMGHGYLIFYYPIYKSPVVPLYLFGHAAVMVLFINSGFLIAKSASANIQRNQHFNLYQYTAARVNRILPPFYFSLIFMVGIYFIAPYFFATGSRDFMPISPVMSRAKVQLDLTSITGCLLFINEFLTKTPVMNFAYWTLPFEVWCYAIFGLLIWVKKRGGVIVAGIITLILTLLNVTFICYLMVWGLGVWLAIQHNQNQPFSKRTIYTLLSGSLLMLVLGWCVYQFMLPKGADQEKILLALYGMVSGLWVSTLIYAVIHQKIHFPRCFEIFSKSSYTLYLIHFPILLFVYGVIQPYIYASFWVLSIAYILSIGLCVGLAMLIAKKVEHIRLL